MLWRPSASNLVPHLPSRIRLILDVPASGRARPSDGARAMGCQDPRRRRTRPASVPPYGLPGHARLAGLRSSTGVLMSVECRVLVPPLWRAGARLVAALDGARHRG